MQLRTSVLASFEALKDGDKQKSVSPYQPTDAVRQRLIEVQNDMARADKVRNKSYEEFNFKTLAQILSRDRKAFNSYVPPNTLNPDEAWRAQTVRPVTRNKVISIAAHITSSLLFPQIFAQNQNDDEDKDAAMVMRDIMLWTNEQSKYAPTFVKAVVKALVDPVMIMEEGYAEVMRKVKVLQKDGSYTTAEILDEVYSGFINALVPCEELYIANAYESDIQKQPFLIRQRFIDYADAKAKYDTPKNPDWKYVEPGIVNFYSQQHNGFYKMYDQNLEGNLVEEIVYYNRHADLELIFVNGVLISHPDRPIQRADKLYPFAKTGYEFFAGTDFFYYKSLVSKMSSDQEVIDTLYNMIIDGTYLQVMPPGVISGDEDIDASVIAPGVITTLSEESKFQTINTNNNLNAGLATLQKVEQSISESSADRLSQGMSAEGTPATAYEVSRIETNARTMLGLFGKMIATFVEDFGNLRSSTILQYMTTATASEVVGDTTRLKYRQFLLPAGEGRQRTKKIQLDIETPTTKEGRRKKSFELYEAKVRKGTEIVAVNPELFRRNKYMTKVKADFMPEQSEAVKKSLNLEAYDRAIQNPFLDQERITADFLIESYRPGESDKYMKKQSPMQQAAMSSVNIPGGNSNMTSQILNKSQAKAIT